MKMTKNERDRLIAPKLNKHCQKTDNRYLARAVINGKLITGKKYDTVEQCNEGQLKLIKDRSN